MFSFKRSLIALLGLLVIVGALATLMPLVSRGQGGNPFNQDPRKSYYLTQTIHTGSQALTACAEGYHMASLWEIFDTSNLRYNTELGFNNPDSGFGPPAGISGWIRTGYVDTDFNFPGAGNCNAWTSASFADFGTDAALPIVWDSLNVTVITPWISGTTTCNSNIKLWCMQD
jgi:hypothetical protein